MQVQNTLIILETTVLPGTSKNIILPALTEKDQKSINYAMNEGIKFYAMSFVNYSSDIFIL